MQYNACYSLGLGIKCNILRVLIATLLLWGALAIRDLWGSLSTPVDKLPQRSAAEKLPEPAKNIINSEAVKDMAEKGQNMMDALKAKGDELAAVRNADRKERADEAKIALDAALTGERRSEAMFSVRDALRIMYSLMLIDGIVSPEEGKKFDEMGLAYDQDFDIFKKQLIDESYTAAQSESALGVEFVSIESEDSGEYYDQIHDYVENLIREEGQRID